MDRIAVRLLIRGRVQGVGYRWWARGEAERLGLDGWIRNRLDGAVELVAVGPEALIQELTDLCRRGPPGAAVEAVDRLAAEDKGHKGFEERPTI